MDIKDDFWKVIEDIVPILEPLADLTEVLGKEDCPTASAVYVVLYSIFSNFLAEKQSDSGVAKNLKLKIKQGLQKRFKVDMNGQPQDEILSSPLLLATLLDPRYKTMVSDKLVPPEKIEVLYLIVVDLIEAEEPIVAPIKQEVDPDSEPVPVKKSRVFDILKGEVLDLSENAGRNGRSELEDYLKEQVTTSDPLKWWETNCTKFPRISNLAKKYLSIPATSVPSERVFSVAGLTVTKLRASLDADTVDQIIFLNKNTKAACRMHAKLECVGAQVSMPKVDTTVNAESTEIKQENI